MTWTYLVSDDVFGSNLLRTLANHATFGLWATMFWVSLPFVWGIFLHWRRRREWKVSDWRDRESSR